MFGSNSFYHGAIRKTVIVFGTLFNDIKINKFDKNGDIIKVIPIPLSYGPREKYLSRLNTKENPLSLPRLSFELSDISYDPERKLSKADTIVKEIKDDAVRNLVFNPVPYNFSFTVSAMVKSSDDGLQIVEQVLPYFSPSFNVTIDILPDMEITKDITIIMTDISSDEDYEGDYTSKRSIIWTMNFLVKTYLYGPIRQQSVITKAITNIKDNNDVTLTRQVVDENDYDKDDNFGFGDSLTDYPDSEI